MPVPEADDLYGLPLEEFVSARDALAKRLRAAGDREAADAVRRLRKPSAAAWAANQALRSQPAARRELLEAAGQLRHTQERVLAGNATASDLERVAGREREAVERLVEAARGLLTGGGRSLGAPVLERVRETLHAAAVDDEVRELAEAGRLDRERQAAGLGPAPAARPAGGRKRRGPADRERRSTRARGKQRTREDDAVPRAREALKAARAGERDARRGVAGAEREAASARHEASAARRTLEASERTLRDAEGRLAGAERELDRAVEEREAAERRLEEARGRR